MYKIFNYKNIGEDKFLVSYTEKLDYNLIKSHTLDMIKIKSIYQDKESKNRSITYVVISACITAYARVHISRLKLYIINELKGNIYYSDPDSLVTDIKLPNTMVHPTNLGK
jgi:hypothetical protein